MLHIVWIIIKWIFIILGALLGLLLLALLVILFSPLRYQASAKKDEHEQQAYAACSWLLHILSVKFQYENRQTQLGIYLFGISTEKWKKLFSRRQETSKKNAPEISHTDFQGDTKITGTYEESKKADTQEEIAADVLENETIEETEATAESAGAIRESVTIPENSLTDFEDSKQKLHVFSGLWTKLKETVQSIWKSIRWLLEIPRRVFRFFRKIALTFRNGYGKIEQWKNFLDEEQTRSAIRFSWERAVRILKHIRPRKLRGHLTYGTGDPASTGQILAGIGMTSPIHKNRVQIVPVFDEKILEGEIEMKGRLFAVVFLIVALQFFFHKDVRYVVKSLKHKEE